MELPPKGACGVAIWEPAGRIVAFMPCQNPTELVDKYRTNEIFAQKNTAAENRPLQATSLFTF